MASSSPILIKPLVSFFNYYRKFDNNHICEEKKEIIVDANLVQRFL